MYQFLSRQFKSRFFTPGSVDELRNVLYLSGNKPKLFHDLLFAKPNAIFGD